MEECTDCDKIKSRGFFGVSGADRRCFDVDIATEDTFLEVVVDVDVDVDIGAVVEAKVEAEIDVDGEVDVVGRVVDEDNGTDATDDDMTGFEDIRRLEVDILELLIRLELCRDDD